jgi:hypothetical protein
LFAGIVIDLCLLVQLTALLFVKQTASALTWNGERKFPKTLSSSTDLSFFFGSSLKRFLSTHFVRHIERNAQFSCFLVNNAMKQRRS